MTLVCSPSSKDRVNEKEVVPASTLLSPSLEATSEFRFGSFSGDEDVLYFCIAVGTLLSSLGLFKLYLVKYTDSTFT